MNNFASRNVDDVWRDGVGDRERGESFATGQAQRYALPIEPGTFADMEYADGCLSLPWLNDGSFGLVDR